MSIVTGDTTLADRAWHALHHGAVLTDRSDRLRMLFSGGKAAESLTGLVTNDVVALTPGRGQYAAALTAKGKILADLRIFAREDGLLVDVGAGAAPNFLAMVKKFVNPRLAKYQDISQQTGDIGLFGAGAAGIARSVFPDAQLPSDLPNYSHVSAGGGAASVMIARVPDFGVEGYDIIGPREVMDEIRTRLASTGAISDADDALEIARIEAGRPVWGVDINDTMLAQESDMDRLEAISFTKGCYTGQETVARVHYRGHVNRLLRGLRVREPILPPPGTPLTDASGKEVGAVKSGAHSPRHGAIALALVRREIEPGATVTARWADQAAEARVQALPFQDD